jgi:hypothetical protein
MAQQCLTPLVQRKVAAVLVADTELLKPAPNDRLQKCPVSTQVNSSRADDDDPTLIGEFTLAPDETRAPSRRNISNGRPRGLA